MFFNRTSKRTNKPLLDLQAMTSIIAASDDYASLFHIARENRQALFDIALSTANNGPTNWQLVKSDCHNLGVKFTPAVAEYITSVQFAIVKYTGNEAAFNAQA